MKYKPWWNSFLFSSFFSFLFFVFLFMSSSFSNKFCWSWIDQSCFSSWSCCCCWGWSSWKDFVVRSSSFSWSHKRFVSAKVSASSFPHPVLEGSFGISWSDPKVVRSSCCSESPWAQQLRILDGKLKLIHVKLLLVDNKLKLCKITVLMQDDKLKLHKIKQITIKMTSSRTKLGKVLGFEAGNCFREAHKALVEAKGLLLQGSRRATPSYKLILWSSRRAGGLEGWKPLKLYLLQTCQGQSWDLKAQAGTCQAVSLKAACKLFCCKLSCWKPIVKADRSSLSTE